VSLILAARTKELAAIIYVRNVQIGHIEDNFFIKKNSCKYKWPNWLLSSCLISNIY